MEVDWICGGVQENTVAVGMKFTRRNSGTVLLRNLLGNAILDLSLPLKNSTLLVDIELCHCSVSLDRRNIAGLCNKVTMV